MDCGRQCLKLHEGLIENDVESYLSFEKRQADYCSGLFEEHMVLVQNGKISV